MKYYDISGGLKSEFFQGLDALRAGIPSDIPSGQALIKRAAVLREKAFQGSAIGAAHSIDELTRIQAELKAIAEESFTRGFPKAREIAGEFLGRIAQIPSSSQGFEPPDEQTTLANARNFMESKLTKIAEILHNEPRRSEVFDYLRKTSKELLRAVVGKDLKKSDLVSLEKRFSELFGVCKDFGSVLPEQFLPISNELKNGVAGSIAMIERWAPKP